MKFKILLFFALLGTLALSGQNGQGAVNKNEIKESKSEQSFQLVGRYIKHFENEKYIDFQCKNASFMNFY
jgi:hypothetical protein